MAARRIIVLGAGVVGVTTAYKLAAAGHEVAVIEGEHRAAMLTSFANAGLLAPAQGCLGLAIGTGADAALAVARRPGNQAAAPRLLATMAVDAALPSRMHGGAAQH